mgnify:CR=1 FL=1
MTQYIDKSALVAEIEERIAEYKDMKIDSSYYEGMVASLEFFRDEFINTLEVKEVDLDDYYHKFLDKEWFNATHVRTMSEMMAFTAKHFFELGLKAQKEE